MIALTFLDRFGFAVRRTLGTRGGTVTALQPQEFVGLLRSGAWDMATVRPRMSPPIMAAFTFRTGVTSNMLHYSDPAVDAAIDARDWAALERAFEADPPGAIVCSSPSIVVLDSRIRLPPLGASGFMGSLPQWEVQQ